MSKDVGEREFSIDLIDCPWCGVSPKYFPEFYEDSSRAFRNIGCRNEECKAKPITGDYSIDKLRREAWNEKKYVAVRLNAPPMPTKRKRKT